MTYPAQKWVDLYAKQYIENHPRANTSQGMSPSPNINIQKPDQNKTKQHSPDC